MSWTAYNSTVRLAPLSSFDIGVDNLTLWAEPYSGPNNRMIVELWDGILIQKNDGWRHICEMEWTELKESDHNDLRLAIVETVTQGSMTVDFSPPSGVNTLTDMVFENVELAATFTGAIRSRRASLRIVQASPVAAPATWLISG